MPPRKTAAKKTTAKKTARKPAARKPAKRTYRKKKTDKKLPITYLVAIIPLVLLAAFMYLRFSGEQTSPAPVQKESSVVQKAPKTVIKQIEKTSVADTVKLFLFENSIKNTKLDIEGFDIKITASSKLNAHKLTSELKSYLRSKKIQVQGRDTLTAKDSSGTYSIVFDYVRQTVKERPAAAARKFKAKLAVVIDDCGYSVPLARDLASVKYPVTFAVLPFTPYGVETAEIARDAGKTLFIHFPMQPKSYPDFDPGKGALFLNMPETLIDAVTKANFAYFPMKLDGANNHTGSAFTESAEKMAQALRSIKKYTPRFLDSYTSGSSAAYDTCRKAGMECAVNNIFLDNEEPGLVTVMDKRTHVQKQLIKAARKALGSGSAIAIGHLKKGTVSALESTFAEIEKMGVQIVPVTELMN